MSSSCPESFADTLSNFTDSSCFQEGGDCHRCQCIGTLWDVELKLKDNGKSPCNNGYWFMGDAPSSNQCFAISDVRNGQLYCYGNGRFELCKDSK